MTGQWVEQATEILGTPVADAVPVPRRRSHAWLADIVMLSLFTAGVLWGLLVRPFPPFLVISLATVVSIVLPKLQTEPRFAALTDDDELWMLTATHWFSRPLAPIGLIDPRLVSGPVGLFRLTFIIDGAKHTVAYPHRKPFQRMVETARRRPSDSARS
jgi:hypothetical protein